MYESYAARQSLTVVVRVGLDGVPNGVPDSADLVRERYCWFGLLRVRQLRFEGRRGLFRGLGCREVALTFDQRIAARGQRG